MQAFILTPATDYSNPGLAGFEAPDEAHRKDPNGETLVTSPLCSASETVHELCRWPFPFLCLCLIRSRDSGSLVMGCSRGHESLKTHPFFWWRRGGPCLWRHTKILLNAVVFFLIENIKSVFYINRHFLLSCCYCFTFQPYGLNISFVSKSFFFNMAWLFETISLMLENNCKWPLFQLRRKTNIQIEIFPWMTCRG